MPESRKYQIDWDSPQFSLGHHELVLRFPASGRIPRARADAAEEALWERYWPAGAREVLIDQTEHLLIIRVFGQPARLTALQHCVEFLDDARRLLAE